MQMIHNNEACSMSVTAAGCVGRRGATYRPNGADCPRCAGSGQPPRAQKTFEYKPAQ